MDFSHLETEALAHRQTVEEFVRRYGNAEKNMRDGYALVLRALTAIGESPNVYSGHSLDFSDPGDLAKQMRRSAWRVIVERLQMRRSMSIVAWKEFSEKLEREDPPPLTEEIICGMVAQYRQDLPAMLEASVLEIFEWLRPHYDRYKTNSQFEIGERVILSGVIRRSWRTWDVSSYYTQNLTALENVFEMLAGRVRKESPTVRSRLEMAIALIPLSETCHGTTDLFEFRGHKNGNLHLRFLKMDLVNRLNAIAGGARLKPVA